MNGQICSDPACDNAIHYIFLSNSTPIQAQKFPGTIVCSLIAKFSPLKKNLCIWVGKMLRLKQDALWPLAILQPYVILQDQGSQYQFDFNTRKPPTRTGMSASPKVHHIFVNRCKLISILIPQRLLS